MSNDSDTLIATRVARLTGGKPVEPKHVRFFGAASVLLFVLIAGINFYTWQSRELYPRLIVVAPALLLQGGWFVVDASALSAGTRRHQRALIWTCVGVGSAIGLATLYMLTGGFF